MKHPNTPSDPPRWIGRRLCVLVLLCTGIVVAARGAPPDSPLPAPLYSFDLASVPDLPFDAGDVLRVNPEADIPEQVDWSDNLGLQSPDDELDALSGGNGGVLGAGSFALLISVDRDTVGAAPPSAALVDLGIPYNAQDQVTRGHAAGDQFMSPCCSPWQQAGALPRLPGTSLPSSCATISTKGVRILAAGRQRARRTPPAQIRTTWMRSLCSRTTHPSRCICR